MRADPNHSTQQGVSCLSAACAQSSVPCVEYLLQHRADPNEVIDQDGRQSVLMWASRIEYCDEEGNEHCNPFVSMLLAYRSDTECVDRRGRTALMHACIEGNALAAEALLQARAEVDAKDHEGSTPLQISLRCYHGRISSLLLQYKKKAGSINPDLV